MFEDPAVVDTIVVVVLTVYQLRTLRTIKTGITGACLRSIGIPYEIFDNDEMRPLGCAGACTWRRRKHASFAVNQHRSLLRRRNFAAQHAQETIALKEHYGRLDAVLAGLRARWGRTLEFFDEARCCIGTAPRGSSVIA